MFNHDKPRDAEQVEHINLHTPKCWEMWGGNSMPSHVCTFYLPVANVWINCSLCGAIYFGLYSSIQLLSFKEYYPLVDNYIYQTFIKTMSICVWRW